MRKINLVVDLNNLTSSTRHGKVKNPPSRKHKDPLVRDFLFKEVLTKIIYTATKMSANGLVICADSKGSWRRDLFPFYKANRDVDSYEDMYYEETIAAVELLKEFFTNYTAAYVLSKPTIEADEIMFVWCQECSDEVENVIVTSDGDMAQALAIPNTLVYSHLSTSKGFFESEDPQFDLFVKCIRGDHSDNITSAFRGVRKTRLQKCWEDPLEMANLLETKIDEERTVGEILTRNIDLMDLSAIPAYIRAQIVSMIEEYKPSKYNEMEILKFMGANHMGDFTNMVTKNAYFLKKSPTLRV